MIAAEILLASPEREIATSREVNAPVDLVYKAWADPEHLKNWWGPKGFTNTFKEHDLKPGGKWTFTMYGPDGRGYLNECVFVKVVPPKLLVWNHLSNPVFQFIGQFEVVSKNKTKVHFRQVFETAELCKAIRTFAEGKNEENLDRLEEELKKMQSAKV